MGILGGIDVLRVRIAEETEIYASDVNDELYYQSCILIEGSALVH